MSSQIASTATDTVSIFRKSSSSTDSVNVLFVRTKRSDIRISEILVRFQIRKSSLPNQPLKAVDSFVLTKDAETIREAIREVKQVSVASLGQLNNGDLSFESDGYKVTRDRLISLLREDDEDEPKPTPYAFDTAWKLMIDATKRLQKGFSRASVAADDEGGIRLRWRNLDKNREVSLYCPSSTSGKLYIYHEVGDEYGADYNVSDLALANWLSWLTKNK